LCTNPPTQRATQVAQRNPAQSSATKVPRCDSQVAANLGLLAEDK